MGTLCEEGTTTWGHVFEGEQALLGHRLRILASCQREWEPFLVHRLFHLAGKCMLPQTSGLSLSAPHCCMIVGRFFTVMNICSRKWMETVLPPRQLGGYTV